MVLNTMERWNAVTFVGIHIAPDGIILVSDCRLSDSAGAITDTCQKVTNHNDVAWAVIAFTGGASSGAAMMDLFLERIKSTTQEGMDWLIDEELIADFAKAAWDAFTDSSVPLDQIKSCCIVIGWHDIRGRFRRHYPSRFRGFSVSFPSITVSLLDFGLYSFGSGSYIYDSQRFEIYAQLRDIRDRPAVPRLADRAMFMTVLTDERMLEATAGDQLRSVGGLLQVMVLALDGLRPVSYFKWRSIDDEHGTYVAMRLKQGRSHQEHRPTGQSVEIRLPQSGPYNSVVAFDLRKTLNASSPGVIRIRPGRLGYSLYDVNDVHPDILESWGSEPLDPPSYLPD